MVEGQSVVSGMLTAVQESISLEITGALPIAGIIFGMIAGIMVGVKLFKKLTGARTA